MTVAFCMSSTKTRNFMEVKFGQIRLTRLELFSCCNSSVKCFFFSFLSAKIRKEAIVSPLPFLRVILSGAPIGSESMQAGVWEHSPQRGCRGVAHFSSWKNSISDLKMCLCKGKNHGIQFMVQVDNTRNKII